MHGSQLPTGTVTFLFTDIEGSTRLIDSLGEEDYVQALAEHRRLIREAIAARGGLEVDTQGDAFLFAFANADDAVTAAAAGQAALTGGPVKVRMGLHTGEPRLTGEGYAGRELHRAARIAASGHGGQVVVSAATRMLVDVELTELGEHRLKDFDDPVALFQLGTDQFPPLKTISNTNLPRPSSSFVGRTREVAEVTSLLQGSRLVTLTGPGGSGKTRLAIESAAEFVGDLPAGVFWVGLASLRDPGLVPQAIAETLGAKEDLQAHIGERELLLLLDNLEQVIEAAPELAELVQACPNLRLLVTSRELLRVRGEVEYEVLPLAEPDAVELFCARGRTEPSPSVQELCRRLDNLPLALELAAARSKVLMPDQVLERLSQRLDLLTGGRDADPRQVTLRATIEWSHDLLDEPEQVLFRRLAIFSGGCTLSAAEDVADADPDTLQSLVEKSLVRHTNYRFWMLETVREYALGRLELAREVTELETRHSVFFTRLAERVDEQMLGPAEAEGFAVLHAERDNLRSALTAMIASGDGDAALRLMTGAVQRFWRVSGELAEGRSWLDRALQTTVQDERLRAAGLRALASMAGQQGDLAASAAAAAGALPFFRKIGDRAQIIDTLITLGIVSLQRGDYFHANECFTESEQMSTELGDLFRLAASIDNLGSVAVYEGAYDRALPLFERSARLADQLDHDESRAISMYNVGLCALHLGDLELARRRLRESLTHSASAGSTVITASEGHAVAALLAEQGRYELAIHILGGAEALRCELGFELEPVEQALVDRLIRVAEPTLGTVRLEEARTAGAACSREEFVQLALAALA